MTREEIEARRAELIASLNELTNEEQKLKAEQGQVQAPDTGKRTEETSQRELDIGIQKSGIENEIASLDGQKEGSNEENKNPADKKEEKEEKEPEKQRRSQVDVSGKDGAIFNISVSGSLRPSWSKKDNNNKKEQEANENTESPEIPQAVSTIAKRGLKEMLDHSGEHDIENPQLKEGVRSFYPQACQKLLNGEQVKRSEFYNHLSEHGYEIGNQEETIDVSYSLVSTEIKDKTYLIGVRDKLDESGQSMGQSIFSGQEIFKTSLVENLDQMTIGGVEDQAAAMGVSHKLTKGSMMQPPLQGSGMDSGMDEILM